MGSAGGEAYAGAPGGGADRSLRVILPERFAEVAGAVLMESLGPFELQPTGEPRSATAADGRPVAAPTGASVDVEAAPAAPSGGDVALVFYPAAGAEASPEEVLAKLPSELRASGLVRLETREVPRDWVDGWKAHFKPITVGAVRVRPPWEPAVGFRSSDAPSMGAGGAVQWSGGALTAEAPSPPGSPPPVDVVINPGLGCGTGLHPTTRSTLRLLQQERPAGDVSLPGPLVDAGTGSGILAISAAKLGWGPVFAFDNDREAIKSARENIAVNGVEGIVELHRADLEQASRFWFAGATVLANMTLAPVLALVRRLAREARTLKGMVENEWPARLVVSGILAGMQEDELVAVSAENGFVPGQRVYEAEWVSLELLPTATAGGPTNEGPVPTAPAGGAPSSGGR